MSHRKNKQSTLDNSTTLPGLVDGSKDHESELEDNNQGVNEEQYNYVLEKHFGTNLINYFETFFEKARKSNEYFWDQKKCKIKDLIQNFEKNESIYSDLEDPDNESGFKHAFKYSWRLSEKNNMELTAENYLKDFMRSNINLKSLYNFYSDKYYDEGK